MKKPIYEKRPFELEIPNLSGDGIAETVTIQVEMEWDDEIKEWLLAPGAHRFIEDAQARYMGLILPQQMKELRERLLHAFYEMRSATDSDVAAAILTLANVIENKHYFDRSSSENFGHELSLGLQALFEQKSLSVNANVTIEEQ